MHLLLKYSRDTELFKATELISEEALYYGS